MNPVVLALLLGACEGEVPMSDLRYPEIVAAILARVDTDRDGVVGAEEYALVASETEPIALYDRDHDGSLSAAELETMFLTATVNRMAGPGQGMGRPGAEPPR